MAVDKTMALYNAGLEVDEAVARGADRTKFLALEAEYKGASIPVSVLLGFKAHEPYSCDYHTGGAMGAMLRHAIKTANGKVN